MSHVPASRLYPLRYGVHYLQVKSHDGRLGFLARLCEETSDLSFDVIAFTARTFDFWVCFELLQGHIHRELFLAILTFIFIRRHEGLLFTLSLIEIYSAKRGM